ncbi:HD domain-containing protein [Knoellia remsis]|uniref:HD domain-containing protein n=1 Tax=Knoellia remsis TaxID=407159 RepID=A0A2T0UYE6_9MICO|nr:HD domain-containing phosphohydrolase [Knoellia remsis]PRY62942.1 HD domain-containing protein [Knoellia remsis]
MTPGRRVEPLILGLAIASILGAFLTALGSLEEALTEHWLVIAAFVAAIAIGDVFRVQMPSGRVMTPVATSSAIGLAVLGPVEGEAPFDVPAGVVLIIVAAASGVGLGLCRLFGRPVDWTAGAVRTIGVGITAALMRNLPLADGGPWAWQLNPDKPRWLIAVIMLGVAAAGLYVDLVLTGLVRAQRRSMPMRRALAEELGEAQSLTLGLLAAGPLVALLAPIVGLAGLPLGLLPVVLTHIAVRRFVTNRETYRQTIATLSRLTEVAGYTPTGHAARVASLSVGIGRAMDLPSAEVEDLEYAALLHDLGQVGLRSPIPEGATVLAAPDDQRRIASEGATIVRRTEVLDRVADLMERQTMPFRHVREWGEEIPVPSRIIKVANAFDDFSHGSTDPDAVAAALERINLGLGYEYDPEVVDALIRSIPAQP